MVNSQNLIEGETVGAHPLEGARVYSTSPTILAARADQGGIVRTREGQKRFHAGDWIVTDNPPTHAWPVNDQVFNSLYREIESHGPPTGAVPGPATVARAQITKTQTRAQKAAATRARNAKAAGKASKVKGNQMRVPGVKTKAAEAGRDMKDILREQGVADSESTSALG